MVRLLKPADFRSMPWKNGGGRTTEIATHPPGAALDTFEWRVSLADVERDGPFSLFPGIDRTIVLLDGAGMRLHGVARETVLATPFAPHAFSGDEAIDCSLVAGSVRDFNAMFRRSQARGSVAVVRNGGTEFASAQFRLAYAATGAHACVGAERAPLRLESGQVLLVDEPGAAAAPPIAIRPLVAGAVALVVTVERP
jgi:hypothetical protein